MTRQERQAINNIRAWEQSTATSLNDVYDSYSRNKYHAWLNCQNLCKRHHGTGLKVVSHNCHFFTAGFQFVDKKTGVVRYMHMTSMYNTAVDMI